MLLTIKLAANISQIFRHFLSSVYLLFIQFTFDLFPYAFVLDILKKELHLCTSKIQSFLFNRNLKETVFDLFEIFQYLYAVGFFGEGITLTH